jgi:hypothetical protein
LASWLPNCLARPTLRELPLAVVFILTVREAFDRRDHQGLLRLPVQQTTFGQRSAAAYRSGLNAIGFERPERNRSASEGAGFSFTMLKSGIDAS